MELFFQTHLITSFQKSIQRRLHVAIIGALLVLSFGCRTQAGPSSSLQSAANSSNSAEVRAIPGEIYLEELRRLITQAKDSITILHYTFFSESGVTRELATLLKDEKLKKPELKITIVLEGEKDSDKPSGAATRNRKTRDFFAGSGVDVHFISGLRQESTKPGVTHAKAVIIDDTILTGSTNLTNTSVTKNNEFNLLIQDEQAAAFTQHYIRELLADSTTLHNLDHEFSGGKILTDETFAAEAKKLISSAGEGDKLLVATYFFRTLSPDQDRDSVEILNTLLSAKSRGVDIKVFLEQNQDPNFPNPSITESNLKTAQSLSQAGIGVYLDPELKISHAKMILLDGSKKVLLQGSSNLYRGDLTENHQLNILTTDKTAVSNALAWLTAKIAYEGTLFSTQAPAKMFRLWLGYAQDRSDLSSFVRGVNNKLVPATTAYARGRGLDAYLPALLAPTANARDVPDEVAVIAYRNADMYNAARLTPPLGPQYGPLHFEPGLFAKSAGENLASTSVLALPYDRKQFKLKRGLSGYQLRADAVSWQNGRIRLTVLKPRAGITFETSAQRLFDTLELGISNRTINAALVALDSINQTIIYWTHHTSEQGQVAMSSDYATVIKSINYRGQPAGSTHFELDEAINVLFDTELLDHSSLIGPILEASRI